MGCVNTMALRGRHGVRGCLLFLAMLVFLVSSFAAHGTEDLKATAHDLVNQLFDGDAAVILARATPQVRQALSKAQLKTAVESVRTMAGSFRSQVSTRQEQVQGFDVVIVTCAFEKAMVDVQFAFDANGRIAGFFMRPAAPTEQYSSPDYVDPDSFLARDIVVDAGGWPLPGTLTTPVGDGPFPLVVLVHGSGPSDRDASFGPNKVFKDLAEGLASSGVAALRYDKRTFEHARRIATLAEFTPKEELIDDAIAAVALARTVSKIDGKRVYVLGHSLGGMMAPRIAQADTTIAGLIIMAGAVRSMEQSIVDQARYLAEYDGQESADERQHLRELERFARRVRSIQPGDDPVVGGGTSAPASYWLSMRDYDPPVTAAGLPQDLLVLQGARDYQVTPADFERWQSALREHPRSQTILYPALDHLFFAGAGKSHPQEYSKAGHVEAEVIADIAGWIKGLPSRP